MISVVVVALQISSDTNDITVRMLLVSHGLCQSQDADKVLGYVVILFQEENHACKTKQIKSNFSVTFPYVDSYGLFKNDFMQVV